MKNMKAIKLFCLLLFLFVSNWAMAEYHLAERTTATELFSERTR